MPGRSDDHAIEIEQSDFGEQGNIVVLRGYRFADNTTKVALAASWRTLPKIFLSLA